MNKQEIQETDREATRAEKILALALTVFLLIGGLRMAWAIDSAFPYPDYMKLREQFISASLEQERIIIFNQKNEKLAALQNLQIEESTLRLQYETAREEYRTLLDRGIDDRLKKAQWEEARDKHEETRTAISAAEAALRDFQNNIVAPKEKVFAEAERLFHERLAQLTGQRNRQAGLALMIYALAGFVLTLWIFNLFRGKPRLSRYTVIGTSFLGFGALQMLIISYYIASPFLRDWLPTEWIVSLGGSILSIAGIIFLKNKFLSTEAVNNRRLWKKACPACGFPHPGNYCIRCGVAQKSSCASCGLLTNRFSPWCQECGSKQTRPPEDASRRSPR